MYYWRSVKKVMSSIVYMENSDVIVLYSDISALSYRTIEKYLDSIQIIKRIRVLNMTSRKRRIESIVGEILLQKCFEKIGMGYSSVKVSYNSYGKPLSDYCNVYFNISHSDNYVVCAMARSEVGIDIEKIDADFEYRSVKNIFCSNTQKNYQDIKDFYNDWVIKESFLKYIGCGLNIALKNININHTSKVVEDNQDFPEVKAHFKLFNIDRNYSVGLILLIYIC